MEVFLALLNRSDIDGNFVDYNGMNYLHFAAQAVENSFEYVEHLLNRTSVNVNKMTEDEQKTSLGIAVEMGNSESAQLLASLPEETVWPDLVEGSFTLTACQTPRLLIDLKTF